MRMIHPYHMCSGMLIGPWNRGQYDELMGSCVRRVLELVHVCTTPLTCQSSPRASPKSDSINSTTTPKSQRIICRRNLSIAWDVYGGTWYSTKVTLSYHVQNVLQVCVSNLKSTALPLNPSSFPTCKQKHMLFRPKNNLLLSQPCNWPMSHFHHAFSAPSISILGSALNLFRLQQAVFPIQP